MTDKHNNQSGSSQPSFRIIVDYSYWVNTSSTESVIITNRRES